MRSASAQAARVYGVMLIVSTDVCSERPGAVTAGVRTATTPIRHYLAQASVSRRPRPGTVRDRAP